MRLHLLFLIWSLRPISSPHRREMSRLIYAFSVSFIYWGFCFSGSALCCFNGRLSGKFRWSKQLSFSLLTSLSSKFSSSTIATTKSPFHCVCWCVATASASLTGSGLFQERRWSLLSNPAIQNWNCVPRIRFIITTLVGSLSITWKNGLFFSTYGTVIVSWFLPLS